VGVVQFDRATNNVIITGAIRSGFYVTLSELVMNNSPYLLARIAQLVQKGQLISKDNERFDLVLAPASQWRNEVVMPTFGSSYSNEFFIGIQPLMNNGSFWSMIQLQYEVGEVYQEAANRGDAQSLFEFAEELNLMSTNAQVDALLKHKEAQSVILRRERRPLTQYETLRILRDLVRAIQCISSQGFVHRDIKPDNVLVDGLRKRGRMADFGLMAVKGSPFTGPAGTLYYMPEVIVNQQGQSLISPTAPLVDSLLDIYALGKSVREAFEFYSSNELSGSVVTPLILRSLVSDSTDNVAVKLASANVFYSPDQKIDVAKAPISSEMSEAVVDTMNSLANLLTDEKYAQQWKADTTPVQRELKNYYAPPSLLVVAESAMSILMACIENECLDRWGPANIIV
jgi:serine/threonine protein kinase